MTIFIKKISTTATIPKYIHPHDAGMDLYANETIIINQGERKLIPTGIAMAIPSGYVGLIWDKSGIATNQGLKTMAGVIDSGYRGEIKVLIHNLSSQSYTVQAGTKIAQMLIQPVVQNEIVEIQELDDTSRGEGGFGSTGMK
ncbi:MAG: dUTP diphosphatase [Nanoarchaeota archaeon]|nr:dUTP diphosphatase [Nanoarchaeota archaeon]